MNSVSTTSSHEEHEGYFVDLDYVRRLESKIRELEAEITVLQREVDFYKNEIDKLLSPPLIEAVVLEVLDDDRAIVKSTTGPNLIVHISGLVDRSKVRPGVYVALNQRGSAIVEVLPHREDPMVRAMEV
ncbi:MAG TPA: proteasome-activating nucleotidase, partial [Acidilobales archaeon]|nr:proteasome-activating nucleotidase [Acidilobales archaeon]